MNPTSQPNNAQRGGILPTQAKAAKITSNAISNNNGRIKADPHNLRMPLHKAGISVPPKDTYTTHKHRKDVPYFSDVQCKYNQEEVNICRSGKKSVKTTENSVITEMGRGTR
jgi:hypothetical protein